MKTVYSSQITFMDTTDSRKLEVSISSNLPTMQVCNINTGECSPDWNTNNLVLTPITFCDSVEVTANTHIQWFRKIDSSNDEVLSNAGNVLTITENVLGIEHNTVTYTCTATYDGLSATSRIIFTRVDTGTDSVAFQVYAPDGYLLTKTIPEITLQTFAYAGNIPIYEGATYEWAEQIDNEWVATGDTTDNITITRDEVFQSKSYRCAMTYNNNIYYSTITVQDEGDIYNAIVCVASNASSTSGEYYWILHTMVYSETDEIDPLLGIISQTAPEAPVENDYWYEVDIDTQTVTLKKYNGSEWEISDDVQQLIYNWSMIVDNHKTPYNETSKVQIVSSYDFTSTTTFICDVYGAADDFLTQTSLSLTDSSDPILSEEEPQNPSNGQLWIKPNSNGSFVLFVWDEANETWVVADADTRNRVYTSRPSSYSEGDLWITASNDDHGLYLQGTLLQAQASNTTYNADDWSPSLKYDRDIEEVQTQLNDLNQYITMSSDGLRIRAKTDAGESSPYNSLFTSTKLAFCDGDTELLTIGKSDDDLDAPSRVIAPEIEVKNDLVVGQTISLGDLRFIIEDNGSFSFVVDR